jgi:hypothetical protein
MAAQGLRAVLAVFCAVGGLSGCSLEVSFDGSRYQCDPPAGACPEGYTCQANGYCSDEGGGVDAGPIADADPLAPDASRPDADTSPQAVTVTFGERATSMVQSVTADTEIDSDNPNGNYGGDGRFYCGRHSNPTTIWVGLLRFDVSAIPPGATVQSASLELWTGTDALDQGTVQWHRVLESWTEGSGDGSGPAGVANYSQRVQGTAWATTGAASPGSSDATIVSELATHLNDTPYTFQLPASLVQAWVTSPASNFGMAAFVSQGVDSDTDFRSHEFSQADHRPELTVTYVP